jgi:hypothetical protein
MAHFAQLDDNSKVTNVIVIGDADCKDSKGKESEAIGIEFCKSLFGEETEWVKTSYNGSIRKNFAGIGFTYEKARDAFIPPKPFESWLLNDNDCTWYAPLPVPAPKEGFDYFWNEESKSWVEVPATLDPNREKPQD